MGFSWAAETKVLRKTIELHLSVHSVLLRSSCGQLLSMNIISSLGLLARLHLSQIIPPKHFRPVLFTRITNKKGKMDQSDILA